MAVIHYGKNVRTSDVVILDKASKMLLNIYHAYKEVWEAAVGELLVCEREPENASDQTYWRCLIGHVEGEQLPT